MPESEFRHSWVTTVWPSQHIVKDGGPTHQTGGQYINTYCGLYRTFSDPATMGFSSIPDAERKTCENCFRFRERAG